MKKLLVLCTLYGVAACSNSTTPAQVQATFACVAATNGALLGVVTQPAGTTVPVKVLTGVGTLTAVGATDPNCAAAIATHLASKTVAAAPPTVTIVTSPQPAATTSASPVATVTAPK